MNVERSLGAMIGLLGFLILWMALGWMAALGVLLALWGNNLERSGRGV